MKALVDHTGKTVGRWTVLRRIEKKPQAMWLCRCACGNERVIHMWSSMSCGCLLLERIRETNTRHGQSHAEVRGAIYSAEYRTWTSMKRRCYNPHVKNYYLYGGRGIRVADVWRHSFERFLADMGPRPEGASLDRYPDTNGHYEPGNTRWATMREQQQNRRNNRLITIGGETMVLIEWARRAGLRVGTLRRRIEEGWPEECLLEPALPGVSLHHRTAAPREPDRYSDGNVCLHCGIRISNAATTCVHCMGGSAPKERKIVAALLHLGLLGPPLNYTRIGAGFSVSRERGSQLVASGLCLLQRRSA